jgi:hypothetical protein
MQIIKMLLVSVLLGLCCSSNAAVIWDWQFEDDNLGTVDPHSLLQAKVVLTNDIASTGIINANRLEGPSLSGVGLHTVMLDGVFSFTNETGFGSNEPFPWGNFTSYFYSINLAPGSSVTLDFAWVRSLLPDGFAPGHYTMDASISLCENDCVGFPPSITKTRTLYWDVGDVVTVPESNSLILLLIGLIFLLLRRKLINN